MLEVIRLPVSPSAIARLKAQGLREASAPSALFSGGGTVCLQQLNRSFESESGDDDLLASYVLCASYPAGKETVGRGRGSVFISYINESVQ